MGGITQVKMKDIVKKKNMTALTWNHYVCYSVMLWYVHINN